MSLLRYALVGASLWYIGAYVAVAISRVTYPFDLEWMEGGSVDHVARLLRGEPLYVAPHLEFIPYEYPPVYFYVSALLAKVVGIGFTPLRLVSVVASLVCFGCIYRLVKAETDHTLAGVLAVGLFAATFRIGGAWLDLARVDSLFLALFLVAIVILHGSTSARGHVAAGVLLSLSFLTKQPALPMALPLVLVAVYARGRLGLWLAGSMAVVSGSATLLLHVVTDGWHTFYVWWFPFQHPFARPVWLTFWTRDLFAHLPVAFTAALMMAGLLPFGGRREALFWPALFVGMVGAAYRSRLQTGGYDNVLLPAYAIVAILLGLVVGRVAASPLGWAATRRRSVETTVYAACLIQMALLVYDPRTQVPRAADRAAGDRLVQRLASVEGDVLVPYHGYLATLAGKPAHAHLMQVFDILKIGDAGSARLAQEFRSAIRQRAFGAIVLDDRASYAFTPDVDAAYDLQSMVFTEPAVFLPVTGGVITRPEYFYVPQPGPRRAEDILRRSRRGARP